ncbi:MAG: 16S rRNA (cytosine(1402)-N(4))-methyltransferase RsmH [bacterium]|nr:16S rRNA (cytosine(1402)-N(4))-methyltransferase RsmH [bacterium]
MHTPVLLKEVIDGLHPHNGETVFDATLGLGGHARALCELIGPTGFLVGTDLDENILSKTKEDLKDVSCRLCFQNFNFRNLETALEACDIKSVDVILFDLGWNMLQVEQSGRGFSFLKKEPLLMTFRAHPKEEDLTAYEIVNYWEEKQIEKILKEYGEERFARKITEAIITARARKPIGYADELAGIVRDAIPKRFQNNRVHPATKTFQALRIAVNDELNALTDALHKGFIHLNKGGRIGVISFHSLEDRIVKHFFKLHEKANELIILTKKPITPTAEEIQKNRRSRSAKLRIAQKT